MPSLRASLIRRVLRWRRGLIAEDAPVERFRAEAGLGDRFYRGPRGVQVLPLLAGEARAEWIIPPAAPQRPVILYVHGGGWIMGLDNIHRRMIARLARAASGRALAVDYRLAPEHPFPAALEDCVAAYRWLLDTGIPPEEVVIAGDSAGGNLTLATLIALRDGGDLLPAAALCISPLTDLTGTGETFQQTTDAALLAGFVVTAIDAYAGGHDVRDPLLSPLDADLSGLPPLLIQVGGDEILLSDAVGFAGKARAAGVEVDLGVWAHMWHVWHVFAPFLPEAEAALNAMGAFAREHAGSRGQPQERPKEMGVVPRSSPLISG
jgi:acetyl esterase/lipase